MPERGPRRHQRRRVGVGRSMLKVGMGCLPNLAAVHCQTLYRGETEASRFSPSKETRIDSKSRT